MSLLLVLLGCLEPFPTDRHDLVELRIVGMSAGDDGALRAFTWEGTDAWSDAAPARAWEGYVNCGGAGCFLPGPGTATLTITGEGGATETGELTVSVGAQTPVLNGFTRTLGDDGGSLALDVPGANRVHFMAPAGEISETGFSSTTYTAPGEGLWPVVALWMDGLGANDWATFDLPVGVEGPFLAVGTRLLPVDTVLPPGEVTVLATITAADADLGFTLTGVTLDDGSEVDAPCGTTDGVWDPNVVIERVCGRDEVVGARVRIVGEGQP